jgi:hypothetical protein
VLVVVIVLISMRRWRRIVCSRRRRQRGVVSILCVGIRVVVLGGRIASLTRSTGTGRGMRRLLLSRRDLLARGGAASGHLGKAGEDWKGHFLGSCTKMRLAAKFILCLVFSGAERGFTALSSWGGKGGIKSGSQLQGPTQDGGTVQAPCSTRRKAARSTQIQAR